MYDMYTYKHTYSVCISVKFATNIEFFGCRLLLPSCLTSRQTICSRLYSMKTMFLAHLDKKRVERGHTYFGVFTIPCTHTGKYVKKIYVYVCSSIFEYYQPRGFQLLWKFVWHKIGLKCWTRFISVCLNNWQQQK